MVTVVVVMAAAAAGGVSMGIAERGPRVPVWLGCVRTVAAGVVL